MAAGLLLRGSRPIGFGEADGAAIDVAIDVNGRIAATGPTGSLTPGADVEIFEAGGLFLSPGWTDLHVHVWHGGTDISIRPRDCGISRGVTTMVDAGSAGEANFHGFREFVITPARERIRAFLNIGSIGLVAANRVSELADSRSIDIDRTLACVEANRDLIVGIKVRASEVILRSSGLTPVKVAKKVAKILKLPLMAHVGEPPPLYDEVLEILGPGDIVTHCFNGKAGGSLIEDEDLFALAEESARRGVRLDVGHGGASFSFRVARTAIERGLRPFSISSDLHLRSLNHPVWDLATTMSKVMATGLSLEQTIEAVTRAPLSAIGLPPPSLAVGAPADVTLFEILDTDLTLSDSLGDTARIEKLIAPRHVVLGADLYAASRYKPLTS